GLYSVIAPSPGSSEVEQTLYVAEGSVAALPTAFGGAGLSPQLGVLSTIDGEVLALRVDGAPGLAGTMTAKVTGPAGGGSGSAVTMPANGTGPAGWTSGRSWSRNIDTSRAYVPIAGVSVAAGAYTVELFPSGQPGVSVDVTISAPLRANLVRGIRTSLLSAS